MALPPHPRLSQLVLLAAILTSALASAPGSCASYHTGHGDYDPSGCILNPDGQWHVFPDNGHWGHCTSPDLFHWNCSHPSTGFDGDTGSITVTDKGVFALWPAVGKGPQGVLMATPNDPNKLEVWTPHGMVGVPPAGTGGFRDPGRAIELKSGWYVPGGVSGPGGKGGGIHWFRDESGGAMSNLTHTGWLLSSNVITEMECPDVFALDNKVVVLTSTQGLNGWTQLYVGSISSDDLSFSQDYTERLDFGANGISTIYAAKTGTNAHPPFDRRVLFGFGGWTEKKVTECGNTYLLPKDLSIDPTSGKLLQHPVKEVEMLRKARVEGPTLAKGAQIEVLASCHATGPLSGVVGVNTLIDASRSQELFVGYNFSADGVHGVASYGSALGESGKPRVDKTGVLPLPAKDGSFELRVFVDGHLVESFFNGLAVITSVTANKLPGASLSSEFVHNTAAVSCNVTSWVVGL